MSKIMFQPILTTEEWESGKLPSFGVYASLREAKNAWPGKEIAAYFEGDIEEPTYIDKGQPDYDIPVLKPCFVVHTSRWLWGKGATLQEACKNAEVKASDFIAVSIYMLPEGDEIEVLDTGNVSARMDVHMNRVELASNAVKASQLWKWE